jgi:arginine kinase
MSLDKNNNKKISLTQKYLPVQLWDWLSLKTSYGTTIYDCCKSALECPDSSVGLYAPDPEAYDKFSMLFHPVIAEYHKVNVENLVSIHDLGNPDEIQDWPIEFQENIISTRVRVGRTVKGYAMASKLTREVRFVFFY